MNGIKSTYETQQTKTQIALQNISFLNFPLCLLCKQRMTLMGAFLFDVLKFFFLLLLLPELKVKSSFYKTD